jgi:glycine amidinotransferase
MSGTDTVGVTPGLAPAATAARRVAVNCWDEFTTLREIIVGDATHARIPRQSDPSAWLQCYPTMAASEVARIPTGEFPRQVIEESNEDLATLADTLRALGVVVHHPPSLRHDLEFGTPNWRSSGYLSYCPRDLTLIVGSTIIEVASPMRARYFEVFNLRPLFLDCLRRGATWLSAPRPRLADDLYGLDKEGYPVLGESEPVFDAANILRLGRDLFYQVSRSGNELGLRWLESMVRLLGDLRVHPLREIYGYTHIDSTITLLRPGLLLLNPGRLRPEDIPRQFAGWDVIWCPPIERQPTALPYTLSEPWISMNLLMINPELAIVDATQPALVRALERHGIETVPLQLRHAQVLGGGFHCVTLDIVRDGGPEDYLS